MNGLPPRRTPTSGLSLRSSFSLTVKAFGCGAGRGAAATAGAPKILLSALVGTNFFLAAFGRVLPLLRGRPLRHLLGSTLAGLGAVVT